MFTSTNKVRFTDAADHSCYVSIESNGKLVCVFINQDNWTSQQLLDKAEQFVKTLNAGVDMIKMAEKHFDIDRED